MYGLNNNTGFGYSQQDNNLKTLNRSINSSKFGQKLKNVEKVTNDIFGSMNDREQVRNGQTGFERIQGMAKLAMKAFGG